MEDGRVDSVMELKVLWQEVEILQRLHAVGITLAVTRKNVNVDLTRGYARVTLMLDNFGKRHLGCRSFHRVVRVRCWASSGQMEFGVNVFKVFL